MKTDSRGGATTSGPMSARSLWVLDAEDRCVRLAWSPTASLADEGESAEAHDAFVIGLVNGICARVRWLRSLMPTAADWS